MIDHKAPSIEAARKMGETGGPAVEDERLAFEAWMSGHCWSVGDVWWDGRGYISPGENAAFVDPVSRRVRQLWAAWRDRAALARMATDDRIDQLETALIHAADSPNIDRAMAIDDTGFSTESLADTLHDCAHKDTGKARAAVSFRKQEGGK